jgi:hypothetical protein
LSGAFANTAFCLLSPDGQKKLTRGGRGPQMSLGRGNEIAQAERIARQYQTTADLREAVVEDFHSFRQALNVASADQRVLVLISGPKAKLDAARLSLRTVASDSRIIGRFHFDFDADDAWVKSIAGGNGDASGIFAIRPGEFGLKGEVLAQMSLDSDNDKILDTLVAANVTFAKTTAKKVYATHVAKGKKLGIYFEGAVPYGEDRDGDGVIDKAPGRGRGRSGEGRPAGNRPAGRQVRADARGRG